MTSTKKTRAVLALEVQTSSTVAELTRMFRRGSILQVRTAEGDVATNAGEIVQADVNAIRGPNGKAEPREAPAPGELGGAYVPAEGEELPPPTHPAGIAKAAANARAARKAKTKRRSSRRS